MSEYSKNTTGRLIVSSAAESSDILYGSGFNAADEYIYLELPTGERITAVSLLELQRAGTECHKNVKVVSQSQIKLSFSEEQRKQHFLILLSKYYHIENWIVPERFPLCHADTLRNAGIGVETAKGDFYPERAVKQPYEIDCIRKSMQATQEAMYQVQDYIREAEVNSEGLLVRRGEILTCEYIRSGVEAEFKRKGYSAGRTIIACGADASAPHCIGSGPVRAHETIVADIFPRSDESGYWGDMTRTFVKGTASPIAKKAFDAVRLASEEVLKVLKPGVTGKNAHLLAAGIMEAAGFKTGHNRDGIPCGFFHGLGHGVGLDIHENPRLSPANPLPLQAGHVVSVEPGLYNPSWGGIRLEDLVVLTEDGIENFCTMPKELEIS